MGKYRKKIKEYSINFAKLNKEAEMGKDVGIEMENLLSQYTEFVVNCNKENDWDLFINNINEDTMLIKNDIQNIRRESVYCVWNMEKYKARMICNSNAEFSEYLDNLKKSVKVECERIEIGKGSKVLFIGSGALPLSLIGISMYTKADCYGIDIDKDAVVLSKKVLEKLGKREEIDIYHSTYDRFSLIKEMTHVIFASTIKEKNEIMNDLYYLTNNDITIGLRYGNGFKSLFNYELGEVDKSLWTKTEDISMSKGIFDLAIYKKTPFSIN